MYHLSFIQYLHTLLSKDDTDPNEWTIRSLDRVESTNDEVVKLFQFYEKVAVLARVQNNGRGREGRTWFSPQGGIWLSIGLRGKYQFKELSTPVVRTVYQVLNSYVECEIKPPNDILVNNKKLCGVLVEAEIKGNHLDQVVIGIGINVNNDIPSEVSNIATRLSEHVHETPDPYVLAADIAASVIKMIESELEVVN